MTYLIVVLRPAEAAGEHTRLLWSSEDLWTQPAPVGFRGLGTGLKLLKQFQHLWFFSLSGVQGMDTPPPKMWA